MKEVKPSKFQFLNPRTKEIEFYINSKFDKSKYEGLPVSYDISISEKKDSEANVELQINLGENGDKTPFYMRLIICSKFRWTDDMEICSEKLLKQNAVTLLMSYARPIIAHTTGDAGFKPYNLPFVDLRDDIAHMD